jgi:hypothetical protein
MYSIYMYLMNETLPFPRLPAHVCQGTRKGESLGYVVEKHVIYNHSCLQASMHVASSIIRKVRCNHPSSEGRRNKA